MDGLTDLDTSLANKSEPITALSHITRVVVVSDSGRVFDQKELYDQGVYLLLQEEGRTLKILPVGRTDYS